jgi:hypothetical protein
MNKTFSELKISEAISVLSEIGDTESAYELDNLIKKNPDNADITVAETLDSEFNKVWKIKEHAYGFLDVQNITDENKIPLVNALTMNADSSLKGRRINIRIGNVYVERYPGLFGGEHEVLFEFSAKHSPTNGDSDDEDIKYTQKYTLRNKGGSGKSGLSVVKGLRVPNNGIDFYLNTIYIANKSEEKVVKFLNNGIFSSGLELISSANPVINQVAGYATGITEYLVEEKRNKVIQEIGLGFDFAGSTEVASLKTGTYVAIQTKRNNFNWSEWYYDKETSLFKPNDGSLERLPFNHITFVISEFEDDNE